MEKLRLWYERLTNFEYWPFWLFNIPVIFYFIFKSIQARSFFFFFSTNPLIYNGGMRGESKMNVYKQIPNKYLPKMLFFKEKVSADKAMTMCMQAGIHFPIIAKPNVGERGRMVKKIENIDQLAAYLLGSGEPIIIQEFIDDPVELGVFFVKMPGESQGKVTSIVIKSFLDVTGDGKSTVAELLKRNKRAQLTYHPSPAELQNWSETIPTNGTKLLVQPIGNHCRGTKFINGNGEIDEQMHRRFNELADQIPEFYYGRFDIKCRSIHDLKTTGYFKILELNGAGAEPAHIYHSGYSLWQAYRDLFRHWRLMHQIAVINKKRGYSYPKFLIGLRSLRRTER